MKNEKYWALVIIIAILIGGGLTAFIYWQKSKQKAGYINEDNLFKLIGQGFNWFNETYASDMVKNGRNSDVTSAIYGQNSSNVSGDIVSMFQS